MNKIHLAVNWADGMKINKSHFIAQDNAVTYNIVSHSSAHVTPLSYGLLPGSDGTSSLSVFISADNMQLLQVRLQQCCAITPGGFFIGFDGDMHLQLPLPAISNAMLAEKRSWYVVLEIDPYQKKPTGEMLAGETPARLPYTTSTISIDLIAVEDVLTHVIGNAQLPIGKISYSGRQFTIDEDYLPPCTTINSHPELLAVHAGLIQFYSKLELDALQIVQKILTKKQANELAVIVQEMCTRIGSCIGIQLSSLHTIGTMQPPAYLVSTTSGLARIIKNTLDTYLGNGKEELINYFVEWCNITQAELEGTMIELCNHQFSQLDINQSLNKISTFTKTVSKLFSQLARLEYIGKRKDAGIFVKEEVVKAAVPNDPPAKRRSFLAD